jgi:hypothetical protein
MREMREEYWAVVENDVDEPGLHLTFDLWMNPYTPLYWDEDTDARTRLPLKNELSRRSPVVNARLPALKWLRRRTRTTRRHSRWYRG